MEPVLEQQWREVARRLTPAVDAAAPFAAFDALAVLADRIGTLGQDEAIVLALRLEEAIASLARLLQARLGELVEQSSLDELIARTQRRMDELTASGAGLADRGRVLDDLAVRARLAETHRRIGEELGAEIERLQEALSHETAWRENAAAFRAQRDQLRARLESDAGAALIGEIERAAQALIVLRREQLETLPGTLRTALAEADALEHDYAAALAKLDQARQRLADFNQQHPDAERRIAAARRHAAANARVAADLPDTERVMARLGAIQQELGEIDAALKLAVMASAEAQTLSRLGFDGTPAR
jgi:hypothetical protein